MTAVAAAGGSVRRWKGRRAQQRSYVKKCVGMASAPGATQAAVPSRFSNVTPQGNKVLLRLNEDAARGMLMSLDGGRDPGNFLTGPDETYYRLTT